MKYLFSAGWPLILESVHSAEILDLRCAEKEQVAEVAGRDRPLDSGEPSRGLTLRIMSIPEGRICLNISQYL